METKIQCPNCTNDFVMTFAENDVSGDIACPHCQAEIHIESDAVPATPVANPIATPKGLVTLRPIGATPEKQISSNPEPSPSKFASALSGLNRKFLILGVSALLALVGLGFFLASQNTGDTPPAPEETTAPEGMTILKAFYGSREQYANGKERDVTQKAKQYVIDGRLYIPHTRQAFGDPHPYRGKFLKITYLVDGKNAPSGKPWEFEHIGGEITLESTAVNKVNHLSLLKGVWRINKIGGNKAEYDVKFGSNNVATRLDTNKKWWTWKLDGKILRCYWFSPSWIRFDVNDDPKVKKWIGRSKSGVRYTMTQISS